MSRHLPHIIETAPSIVKKNRFPIAAQLGVLSLILVGIFGSLLFQNTDPGPTELPPLATPDPVERTEPIRPEKLEDVELRANAAYVWDSNDQRSLYSKNADEPLPLASITKLMTTLLAFELIAEDTTTSVSMDAIRQEGASGFVDGERIAMNELLQYALISSSNDSAYMLAASVGARLGDADPEAQFVRGMNIRAQELGLDTLTFNNTTGLDLSETEPGAVGSATDVSLLMEYIITNHPDLIEPTQQTNARIYNTAGAYHEAENTNTVVTLIPNIIGSKTGFTDLAGGNLTVAFDAGFDRPIIITVLGSTREERFDDVLTLVTAVQHSLGEAK